MLFIRKAPFALRVVQRREGPAAVVYRRRADSAGRDRLLRVGTLGALAFAAGVPLLREATTRSLNSNKPSTRARSLGAGKFHPLNEEWGTRVALYCLVGAGLRDVDRLMLAAGHLRSAQPDEATWWLGQLTRDDNVRPLRALRILVEAVD